jgi:hypothetical protein
MAKHHEHRRKMTVIRAAKWVIALGPVAGAAYSSFKSSGGGAAGASAAVGTLTSAYTGYDVSTGQFAIQNAALGYVPLIAAWLFGKGASRVLR